MRPGEARRMVGAFVASLGAVTLATEACLRAQVPLWAAVPTLALAGMAAFAVSLLVALAIDARRTRLRRRSRQRRRDLCLAKQTARVEFHPGRPSAEVVC